MQILRPADFLRFGIVEQVIDAQAHIAVRRQRRPDIDLTSRIANPARPPTAMNDEHARILLPLFKLRRQIQIRLLRALPAEDPSTGFALDTSSNEAILALFDNSSYIVSTLDYAKQDDVRERVWNERWDLIIIDEAHKCSAYTKVSVGRGDEAEKTKRYQRRSKGA